MKMIKGSSGLEVPATRADLIGNLKRQVEDLKPIRGAF